jgi:LPXTG-motif cell wall-anchored protein
MEMNYAILGIVGFAVILLIVFLVRKNKKDQKDYEHNEIQSDLPPKKHDEEHL